MRGESLRSRDPKTSESLRLIGRWRKAPSHERSPIDRGVVHLRGRWGGGPAGEIVGEFEDDLIACSSRLSPLDFQVDGAVFNAQAGRGSECATEKIQVGDREGAARVAALLRAQPPVG